MRARRRDASVCRERAAASHDRPLAPSASADRDQALRRHRPHPGRGVRAGGRRHPICQPHRGNGAAASAGRLLCRRARRRPRGGARAAAPAGEHGTLRVRPGHAAAGRAGIRRTRHPDPGARPAPGLWPYAQAVAAVRRFDPAGRDGVGVRARRAAVSGAGHGGRILPVHAGAPAPGLGRAAALRPLSRSGAGGCRHQLAHAHRLGVRRRRGERIADRAGRPAAAAPGAVAPARRRHSPRPPCPQRYLGRHPRAGASRRGGQARALGGRLQVQVDRAAAEKGRVRAAQSSARCGDQQHAPGPQHVRRPGAPAGVQQALRRRCTSCRAS